MKRRLLHLLIALDQLAYVVLTLGRGYPDETLSSAAWRMERDGKIAGVFRPLIDFVFWPVQKQHCRKAYEAERRRVQLPVELRVG
jgi:hypothetical protein